MITLITGIPGSGKTSYVVDWLMKQQGRPIFADGVPELKLTHEPCPPLKEWTYEKDDPASASGKKICFSYPPNSIVVIDEAQRVYRPRPVGSKVPPEVAAFETHRHEGLDFVLITQNPTLIDSNVRKLIGRHVHFRPTWAGRYMHEWNECADVESSNARSLAATTRYKLPKRAFDQYHSAVLHTKNKAKIPFVAYIFGAAIIAMCALLWHLYGRYQQISKPAAAATASTVSGAQPGQAGPQGHVLTKHEYVAQYEPRIAGLPHTAPAYDQVTTPQDAPVPVGCIDSKKTGCKCYDQQGTRYSTTEDICRQWIANNGFWIPWKKPDTPAVAAAVAPQAQTSPPAASPPISTIQQEPFSGSHIRPLAGGSHNHAGGLAPVAPKADQPTYTLVPKG